LQEVAVGQDEVGALAGVDAAELIADAEDLRRVLRDRLERLVGW
jgi:hypothetical protein